jgi:hypothetical protein
VLDTPIHQVTFEAGAGASTLTGPFVFGEVGVHPWKTVGMYAKAEASPGQTSIVAGIKGVWDFM